MPREGDKWRVARGDCLWNIARSVYGNGAQWTVIADANGIPRNRTTIFPGQLFTLPGITGGSSSPAPAPAPQPPPAYTLTPNIVWFQLAAGERRKFQVIWEQAHNKFEVRWEIWDLNGHLWMADGGDHSITTKDRQKSDEFTYPDYNDRFVMRCSIRAVDDNGNGLSPWAIKEYDLRNAPPDLPPDPTFEINSQNVLTVTFQNISANINADSIEIAIYQDDTIKYSTAKVSINTETHFAKYTVTVPPGHYYKVRARAVKGASNYGGWTNFTSNDQSVPVAPSKITTLRPQVINESTTKQYGVFIEWTEEKTAKQYEVQWTTNLEYFDQSDKVNSKTTEEGQGPRLLITDIEVGSEYFFRVRSLNDKGHSLNWTPIKSVRLGIKPSAPTTWSNTSSAIIGEDLNLYWTHNSMDNSIERYARLHITVIDSAHPEAEPMEFTKVIENTKPEEEKNTNSVYTINTNDPDWALLQNGFIIKWKVQTAGIIDTYSDWSIEREVTVYTKPSLSLDLLNKDNMSTEEVNNFPFYISVLAEPQTQKPISYYIEVIANKGYSIVDKMGNVRVVNPGDKIYQKYYDPEQNAWRFLVEMTPGNIDLQDGISYTVNVTVAMDSGLSATATQRFNTVLDEQSYQVYADITIDKEILTANINPYCYEYDSNNKENILSNNCTLSIYRREYDGTFTEIATGIKNELNTYVVDPHPSLDYARYRIVAISNKTGTVSYADIEGVPVLDPDVVIQWSEKWSDYDHDDSGDNNIEKPFAGSMIKIPYNVDISENKSPDVSLVEYAGREHPVSYYGTQKGETATWNVAIPSEDKELLYALRRLSRFAGDVYVREPSGTGYWANLTLSFSKNHLETIIPVTFNIKRVEGGM